MTYNPVILPIIRRVMPSIIANDILGVQPMSGPVGNIFSMRGTWHGTLVMQKHHFHHFLRVYNRRKNHSGSYLDSLGYQRIALGYSKVGGARQWCKDTLKHGSYLISINEFWFAYDRDATLFMMRWS